MIFPIHRPPSHHDVLIFTPGNHPDHPCYGVTCKLNLHYHAQVQRPTSQSSQLRTKEFPHPNRCNSWLRPFMHSKKPSRTMRSIFIPIFLCVVCVVANGHNSTTSHSYGVLFTLACCWHQGEIIYVVPNEFSKGWTPENHKCQWNGLQAKNLPFSAWDRLL